MAARDSVRAREAAPAGTAVRDASPVRGSILRGEPLAAADRRERQHTSSLRRFVTGSPLGTVSALFLLFAIVVAFLGPYLGTGDPEAIHPTASFAGPTGEYPMGVTTSAVASSPGSSPVSGSPSPCRRALPCWQPR